MSDWVAIGTAIRRAVVDSNGVKGGHPFVSKKQAFTIAREWLRHITPDLLLGVFDRDSPSNRRFLDVTRTMAQTDFVRCLGASDSLSNGLSSLHSQDAELCAFLLSDLIPNLDVPQARKALIRELRLIIARFIDLIGDTDEFMIGPDGQTQFLTRSHRELFWQNHLAVGPVFSGLDYDPRNHRSFLDILKAEALDTAEDVGEIVADVADVAGQAVGKAASGFLSEIALPGLALIAALIIIRG